MGQPGILYVGVNDNGAIQDQPTNFEDKQKAVTGEIRNIYPPVNPTILVREKDGKKFIAIIVYGSRERPHFAGKSYIRSGTETLDASEENLRQFIAQRSGKVSEILKWKNKDVVVNFLHPEEAHYRVGRIATSQTATVLDCTEHWVSLRPQVVGSTDQSISLKRIDLAFDDRNKRLVLEVSSISA